MKYQFKIDIGATVHPEVEADSLEEAKELAEERAREIAADWISVRKCNLMTTDDPEAESEAIGRHV